MQTPVVLISSAMAVGSRYYRPLVDAFQARGWVAQALPRRGFEPDLPAASRRDDWSYSDEIEVLVSAIENAREQHAGRPVIVLGHSLGAQLAVAAERKAPVDGLVLVGTSVPHFREYPYGGAPVFAMATAIGPLTTVFGYVPRPAFGAPGARTLMREWAGWSRTGNPPFEVDEPSTTPALLIKLQGDAYAVPRAAEAFAQRFLDPAKTQWWTYLRTATPEGGTTDHVAWVRTPEPVVDRIVSWWDEQVSSD